MEEKPSRVPEPIVPNGIYCTSLACCQECPDTFLGGGVESHNALLSAEREDIADVKEQGVEEKEEVEEVEREAKSCEEYNLQIVSQV